MILVNQGTIVTDADQLMRPALAALASEDMLVVAVTGGSDPALLGPSPANARIERFIPFEQLLPHVAVFVTNVGFGGAQLALANGVPILAAGRSEDKAEVAARIAYAGVGIDLHTQRPSARQLRGGVHRLLTKRRFREAAARVQREIATSGRAQGAAALPESLAAEDAAARHPNLYDCHAVPHDAGIRSAQAAEPQPKHLPNSSRNAAREPDEHVPRCSTTRK